MSVVRIDTVNANGFKEKETASAPDACPICHRGVLPELMTAYRSGYDTFQAVWRCPRDDCQSLFIATYKRWGSSTWELWGVAPTAPVEPDVPAVVAAVSPDFVLIYGQATTVDQAGLHHVAGAGFRKAVEFLIKDYVKRTHPEDADKIEGMALAGCIEDYVADARVKEVAKRAVWLGNDETHYVRLWEGKTLADLKHLIDLTIHWIAMERQTEDLLADMAEPKRR
jgi:hypothetical protein